MDFFVPPANINIFFIHCRRCHKGKPPITVFPNQFTRSQISSHHFVRVITPCHKTPFRSNGRDDWRFAFNFSQRFPVRQIQRVKKVITPPKNDPLSINDCRGAINRLFSLMLPNFFPRFCIQCPTNSVVTIHDNPVCLPVRTFRKIHSCRNFIISLY